ncbi:MAG: hypothetical protein AAGA58_02960 [Verrucomicrobiota bacterium]
MKTIIFFLTGIAGGALGMWFIMGIVDEPSSDATANGLVETGELESVQKELDEQATKLKKAQREIATLKEEREMWIEEKRAAAEVAKQSEEEGQGWGQAIEMWGKMQASAEKDQLQKLLGLNAVQTGAFEAAMAELMKEREEAFGMMFSGQASYRQFAIVDGATPQVDAFAEEFLNDEQMLTYEEYKKRKEVDRIERNANEELTQLQMVVSLTDEQKDAAFNIFADFATRETPESYMNLPPGNEAEAFNQDYLAPRVEAMEDILTPDQLQIYTDQSRVMIEMMMGVSDGNAE